MYKLNFNFENVKTGVVFFIFNTYPSKLVMENIFAKILKGLQSYVGSVVS